MLDSLVTVDAPWPAIAHHASGIRTRRAGQSSRRAQVSPLSGDGVILRRLRQEDGEALAARLSKPRIHEHITPPPDTAEEFRRYIQWTRRVRDRYICWGIVPANEVKPVGLIQLWPVHRKDFEVSEWGFVLDDAYWGTGLFRESARLVIDCAFQTLGVHRLEARVSVENGRGNAALKKLGAVRECVLRQNFRLHGRHTDHVLWSLLAPE